MNRLDKIERFLTWLLEAGEISRGMYAELLEIDRCDVDDKVKEIKERKNNE